MTPPTRPPRRLVLITLAIPVVSVAAVLALFGPHVITEPLPRYWAPVLGPAAAIAWVAMLVAESRTGRRIPEFTAIFVGLALAALTLHHGATAPRSLVGEHVRTWSQFHYYAGSKYFGEVGYFDLYVATLAADERFLAAGGEKSESYAVGSKARDMRTYRIRPRAEILAQFDPDSISDERLDELGRDTRYFRVRTYNDHARRVLKDLGYNPTPTWTFFGSQISNRIPLESRAFALLTASDLFAHALVLLVLFWVGGLRTGAVATVWLHAVPLNSTLVIGGFFNYDWLAASVLGYGAYIKGRPTLAGASLAYAAMTRVFPGLLVLPIVAKVGWDLLQRRSPPAARGRFVLVFCLACATLGAIGCLTPRGVDAWPEWKEKISLHSAQHPRSGARRIGLAKLARHQPKMGKRFWRAPSSPDAELAAKFATRKKVVTVLGLALLLAVLWKRGDAEAMLLMLFAVWLLTTSSRYYASIWVLMFLLPVRARDGTLSWPGVVAGTGVMAILGMFEVGFTHTGRYLLTNYLALAMFVALCLAFLITDRRRHLDPAPRSEEHPPPATAPAPEASGSGPQLPTRPAPPSRGT